MPQYDSDRDALVSQNLGRTGGYWCDARAQFKC